MDQTGRGMRQTAVALVFAIGLSLSPSAWCADAMRVHVDYVVPNSCPSALAFGEKIRERIHVRFVDDEEAPVLAVHVEAVSSPNGARRFVGQLTLGDGELAGGRDVSGASCRDVVSGLALIAAIALAHDEEVDVHEETPAPETKPKSPANPDLKTNAPPPYDRVRTVRIVPLRTTKRLWRVDAGINGELAYGIAPQLSFALPIYVEVARTMTETENVPLAMGARFRFVRSTSDSNAAFNWNVFGIDLCPLVWSPSKFRMYLCERTQAGILEAAALNVQTTHEQSRPWVSTGASTSISVMAGPVFFSLEGAFALALIRDRFFVEPDTTVFKTPAIAWTTALGIGAHIW